MAAKYISFSEETTAYNTVGETNSLYYKLLSEDIVTSREDFFPETMEYWTTADKAEGFFRTAGSFSTLMHPLMWPKLLVLFIGDGGSTGAGGNGTTDGSGYQHYWLFGANEVVDVNSTGIKSFTTRIGTGIEKDRQIGGCFIESMDIECVARQPVSVTCNIVGSGDERLVTHVAPAYTKYTSSAGTDSEEVPYMTFDMATTMTVGGDDRLTTAPIIEAIRLNLGRGYDTDHMRLGSKFLAAQTLSGMASVTGSMDFNFTSQDEHERFLAAVGTYAAGAQASFAIALTLRSSQTIGNDVDVFYDITLTMTECYYTGAGSTVSLAGRDRIVQTVNFRANYNSTDAGACKIGAITDTQAYTSLA